VSVSGSAFDPAGLAESHLRRAADMLALRGDAELANEADELAKRCAALGERLRPIMTAEFDELCPSRKRKEVK
jgi:hypothetical protein